MAGKLAENKAAAIRFINTLPVLDTATLAKWMAPDLKIVTTETSVLSHTTPLVELPALAARIKERLPYGVEGTDMDLIAGKSRLRGARKRHHFFGKILQAATSVHL